MWADDVAGGLLFHVAPHQPQVAGVYCAGKRILHIINTTYSQFTSIPFTFRDRIFICPGLNSQSVDSRFNLTENASIIKNIVYIRDDLDNRHS
jgi:hypothetical protein